MARNQILSPCSSSDTDPPLIFIHLTSYHGSSVTPLLAGPPSTGHVVFTEPPPGSGGRDLAGGPHTRHGAGGGTSYRLGQAQPPGCCPLLSTQTHLRPMPPQWSNWIEGVFSCHCYFVLTFHPPPPPSSRDHQAGKGGGRDAGVAHDPVRAGHVRDARPGGQHRKRRSGCSRTAEQSVVGRE